MAATVTGSDPAQRKRSVRRTAVLLTLLALTFYGGFILMSVLRAG